MKPFLVFPICWALYWSGHVASKLMFRLDGDQDNPKPAFQVAFWLYQNTMRASFALQRWAENGGGGSSPTLPWQKAK